MNFANVDPRVLLLAGIALAVLVLLRRSGGLFNLSARGSGVDSGGTSNYQGKFSTGIDSRPRSRDDALDDAPPEVLRWQVEMHETARDLKAEIDTKLVALQTITRHAREERDRLEAAIERARRMGLGPARDALEAIENLATDARSLTDLPPSPRGSTGRPDPHLIAQVRQLAADHTAERIAEKLGLPLGDVELVVGLHQH